MKRWFLYFILFLLAIPLFSWVGLEILRREKRTDITFPSFSLLPAECQGEVKTLRFSPNQTKALMDTLNSLENCTRIELTPGFFSFSNSLTLQKSKGVSVIGSGKKKTILSFAGAGNGNGVDVEAVSGFLIQDLQIIDSPKNGLEVRLSDNIVIDGVEVRWSNNSGPEMTNNGAYGIYPVNVVNIVLQNSESYFASDAGLYVGQCTNALVRYNRAEKNVMGLEIENTINADVYENILENNTGGFLAYDLNKNTIVSRNIWVHNNTIQKNNNPNFAHTGIVKTVPSGVGMIFTSTRDIEISDNLISEHNSADIGILNGLLSVNQDFSLWPMNNWRTYNLYFHHNLFSDKSGRSIDNGSPNGKERPMGELLHMIQKQFQIKEGKESKLGEIVYDGIEPGKTLLVFTTWFGDGSGNANQLCFFQNDKSYAPTLIDLNLPALLQNAEEPTEKTIATAIEMGKVRRYKKDEGYSGAPPQGFACQGYTFQGLPVTFSGIRGKME